MSRSHGSMTCLAVLALATGCSGDSEGPSVLVPVVDHRGITTYRYASTRPSVPAAPVPSGPVSGRQPQFDTEDRRRSQDDLASQTMRIALQQDQARLERQRQQDDQAARDLNRRFQQEQARQDQIFQQQQRQWMELERRRVQLEVLRQEQATRQIDDALRQMQQQQQQEMLHRQFR